MYLQKSAVPAPGNQHVRNLNRAHYQDTIGAFLATSADAICGALASCSGCAVERQQLQVREWRSSSRPVAALMQRATQASTMRPTPIYDLSECPRLIEAPPENVCNIRRSRVASAPGRDPVKRYIRTMSY